jgi:hypothetical protein
MNDDRPFGIFQPCPSHNLEKMLLVSMYALVLKQAEEMKTAPAIFPVIHKLLPFVRLKEFTGTQLIVNTLEFLDDDSPGAHVEVAHLR